MKKPSFIMLAALLCCVLVLVPVVCSILYFGTFVARRLESNARGLLLFILTIWPNGLPPRWIPCAAAFII